MTTDDAGLLGVIYLGFIVVSGRASLSGAELAGGATVVVGFAVPGRTSGKFCLKVAYSSSVGFCEFVLSMAFVLA